MCCVLRLFSLSLFDLPLLLILCRGSRERCEIVEALLRLMIPYTNIGILVTDNKLPVLSLVQVSLRIVDSVHTPLSD